MRSPRVWIRNVTQEAVRAQQNMQTWLFISVFSLERDSSSARFYLFLLLVTTSLRKIVIPGLGNCTRWFFDMTLFQFVSKAKHEAGREGCLAFVGYNSSGTFGRKLVVMKKWWWNMYLWKERKNYFCLQILLSWRKMEWFLIYHSKKYIVPILWTKIKLKCQKCADVFCDTVALVYSRDWVHLVQIYIKIVISNPVINGKIHSCTSGCVLCRVGG